MTIRDQDKYFESLWDWACLDGCFGDTKIAVTDLDGFVERRGKFLVVETKLPGNVIPLGQEITFKSLVGTGYFAVIVVWGHPGVPEKIKTITTKGETIYHTADLNMFRNLVGRWFAYASSTPWNGTDK